MNKISELVTVLIKRLHRGVTLKEMDIAVAWLVIGVAALLVHWNEPINTAKPAIKQYIDCLDLEDLSLQGNNIAKQKVWGYDIKLRIITFITCNYDLF